MNFESPIQNPEQEELENSSEKRYVAIAKTLETLLEQVYALDIPETTLENWEKLGKVMYGLDDILDTAPKEEQVRLVQFLKEQIAQEEEKDEEMQMVSEQIKECIKILEEILQNIDEENKIFFQRLVSMLLDVTMAIKEKADTKEVVRLTRLEGQISAKLFIALLPPSFRESDKYQEMTNLISRIGRIGNTYDTAIDLPGDFQAEQIKVTPTVFHRAAFMAAALSEGLSMMKRGVLTPKTLQLFLRSIKGVSKDKE